MLGIKVKAAKEGKNKAVHKPGPMDNLSVRDHPVAKLRAKVAAVRAL